MHMSVPCPLPRFLDSPPPTRFIKTDYWAKPTLAWLCTCTRRVLSLQLLFIPKYDDGSNDTLSPLFLYYKTDCGGEKLHERKNVLFPTIHVSKVKQRNLLRACKIASFL